MKTEIEDKKIRDTIDKDPQAWYKSIMDQKRELESALTKQKSFSASRVQGRQTVKSVARYLVLFLSMILIPNFEVHVF